MQNTKKIDFIFYCTLIFLACPIKLGNTLYYAASTLLVLSFVLSSLLLNLNIKSLDKYLRFALFFSPFLLFPLLYLLDDSVSIYFFFRRYLYFLLTSLVILLYITNEKFFDNKLLIKGLHLLLLLSGLYAILTFLGFANLNVRHSTAEIFGRVYSNFSYCFYPLLIFSLLKKKYLPFLFASIVIAIQGGRSSLLALTMIFLFAFFFFKLSKKEILIFLFSVILSLSVRVYNDSYVNNFFLNFSTTNANNLKLNNIDNLNKYLEKDVRTVETLNAYNFFNLRDFILGVGFGKKINFKSEIKNTTSQYDIHNGIISSLLYMGIFPSLIYISLIMYYPYAVFRKYKFVSFSFISVFVFDSISSQALLFSTEGILMLMLFYSAVFRRQNSNYESLF